MDPFYKYRFVLLTISIRDEEPAAVSLCTAERGSQLALFEAFDISKSFARLSYA